MWLQRGKGLEELVFMQKIKNGLKWTLTFCEVKTAIQIMHLYNVKQCKIQSAKDDKKSPMSSILVNQFCLTGSITIKAIQTPE